MPVPAKIPASSFTYAVLLKTIRNEIAETKEIIERRQTKSYWKVGRWISQYILAGKDRARYGARVYQKLSEDLDISVDTLQEAIRFSREFPITALRRKLSWSHFRALLRIKDPVKRLALQKEIEQGRISADELSGKITRINAKEKAKLIVEPPAPVRLPVVRGRLYTYQVIYPDALPVKQVPYIDLGFNFWKKIDEEIQFSSSLRAPLACRRQEGLGEGESVTSSLIKFLSLC